MIILWKNKRNMLYIVYGMVESIVVHNTSRENSSGTNVHSPQLRKNMCMYIFRWKFRNSKFGHPSQTRKGIYLHCFQSLGERLHVLDYSTDELSLRHIGDVFSLLQTCFRAIVGGLFFFFFQIFLRKSRNTLA